MRVRAKRTENGFLIPFLKGLEEEEEVELIIEIVPSNESFLDGPAEEYIEENWKTLLLNAVRKPYIDDDQVLADAYWEYKNEKGSD